jgi:acetyl esterase/lipase
MAQRGEQALVADAEPASPGTPAGRPSLRARLLAFFLRLFVRPLLVCSTDLPFLRERLRRLDLLLPSRAPATRSGALGALEVEFFAVEQPRRVLLYLHGGGFCFRPTRAHTTFLVRLSQDLDALGVLPKYRLAPESPFPAALDDCTSTYRSLLERGVPARSIIVAGDSAGGNLTLSLLMRLRDARLPLPGCAVLISPGVDLAGLGERESHTLLGPRDPLVPLEALPRIVIAYAAGHDPAHPGISPLRGSFEGLPPLHFVASAHETLRDDTREAAAKARAAGVAVELRLRPGMVHAFPLFGALPEARAARADIVRFARAHTAEDPAGTAGLCAHLH